MPGPCRAPTVLTEAQLDAFRRRGYVRLREAFPREHALRMQREVWSELRCAHGILRDEPATWRPPPHAPRGAKHAAWDPDRTSPRFAGAISDLVGHDDWSRPANWGGFLLTFPRPSLEPWDVPTDMWHWDGVPGAYGLLIFSFYAEVRAHGGGTLLLAGSQRVIADFYASLSPAERALPHKTHRKMLSQWTPWLADLTGRAPEPCTDRRATFMRRTTDVHGVPCRVIELVGKAGDAVFCDLGLLHSPAPNTGPQPRLMRSKFLFLEESANVGRAQPPNRTRPRRRP